MRDDPELDVGMKDDRDGFEARGGDGPVAAEQFDGMVVGRAALKMDGEMQIAERTVGVGLSFEWFSSRAICQA